jgi:4-hydroxybenzoate polyprenyltransferase
MWQILFRHRYSRLMRLDKHTGIWLLLLPCWWGVLAYSDTVPLATLALFALGAVVMRSCGCILNDLADRDIDAQVTRTRKRPLASGEVTPAQAWGLIGILLVLAFAIAMLLGWGVVALGACWLPLVALYPRMKRLTWWPQAFLGLTFGAGPLFGMVAASGGIHVAGLWLYAAAFFWTMGYDTIYACQDRADDARIGVKSTALLFGGKVRQSVGVLYGLSIVCLLGAVMAADASLFPFVPLLALPCWEYKSMD